MKRITVRAQDPTLQLDGVVFLAQTLDELLFDHSEDSYKAPALNTVSRTIELRRLLQLNQEANLGSAALKSFVEELEWSIRSDSVLDRDEVDGCLIQVGHIQRNLGQPERALRNVEAIQLILGNYFQRCVALLTILVLGNAKEKGRIIAASASFVVQAGLAGFSRRFIYHMTQIRLVRKLQSKAEVDVELLLKRFFDCFKVAPADYFVTFLTNEETESFREALLQFPCVLSDTLQFDNKRAREFASHRGAAELFLTLNKVRARDAIQAREIADAFVDRLSSSVSFYCHDKVLRVTDLALVTRLNDAPGYSPTGQEKLQSQAAESHVVGRGPDPMHCNKISSGKVPIEDIKRMNEVIVGKHLTKTSTNRFSAALEYHRAALLASIPENQLVDLWAALEGLLPQPRSEGPRIEFFVANLLAPLTLTYPEKLLRRACMEVEKEGGAPMEVVRSVPVAGGTFAQLVHLLMATEYVKERTELAEALCQNPLLRFRLWQLSTKFATQRAVLTTLREHRGKVKWHIERIYATRNSIMHNAQALPYLKTLVENLHGYIDTLLTSITQIAFSAHTRVTVDAVLELMLGMESQRFSELEGRKDQADAQCDRSNTWDIVFGRSNSLRPSLVAAS